MGNWNYLKFDKTGTPRKKNVNPVSGAFVWGFDLFDHQVKRCYQYGNDDGYLVVAESNYFDDDCMIVAWASIKERKSKPDLNRIMKCGNYWPPEESLEYQRKLIRVLCQRKPKSAFERQENAAIIAKARAVLAEAKKLQAASA